MCFAAATIQQGFAAGEPDTHEPFRRLAALRRSDFVSAMNSSFAIRRESGTVWLMLISVDDVAFVQGHGETDAFTLRFLAAGVNLPQDTQLLEHDRLGKFPLFLSPGTNGIYTACFNLLKDPRRR